MVFANIHSKLKDLDERVTALMNKSEAMHPASGSSSTDAVDLKPLDDKVTALESKTNALEAEMNTVKPKIDSLPSEYVPPSDVSNLFEKVNQITNILAQFSMQLNSMVERVANVEQTHTKMQVQAQVQAQAPEETE